MKQTFPFNIGTVHIIGIGGIGMSGYAEVLHAQGYKVQGSDQAENANVARLRAQGVRVTVGHAADNIYDEHKELCAVIVRSTAVKDTNPEVAAAKAAGVPVIPRVELLAELMRSKWCVNISGTHGKTTTTSMLAWMLEDAGLKPGFLIGGVAQNFGVSARLGESPFFVIEADEYDTAFCDKRSKFVHYRPRTAILNNLEFDHADIFPDLAAIETQFHHLVRTMPRLGQVIANGAEQALHRVLERGLWSEVQWFNDPDGWHVVGAGQALRVRGPENEDVQGRLDMPGTHNANNALAAMLAARHAGVRPEQALASLERFRGICRRLERIGAAAGVTVYDDFAHHPTAIEETIRALRSEVGSSRIVAVIEPRSNTMKLGVMKARLPVALEGADVAFCLGGASLGWDAAEALKPLGARARVAPTLPELLDGLVAELRAGDHVLVMSNGGFGGIHRLLLARLN